MSEWTAPQLAMLAWQVRAGDYAGLRCELERLGGGWRSLPGHCETAVRPDGAVVGFPTQGTGEPSTACVLVLFALYGPAWNEAPVARAARALVEREWTQQRRAGRAAKPRALQQRTGA